MTHPMIFAQVASQPYRFPFDADFTAGNTAVLCLGMQPHYIERCDGQAVAQRALALIDRLRLRGIADVWTESAHGGPLLARSTPGQTIPLVKENAFFNTDLHQRLTDRGIRNLIIVGFFTDELVHSSTRAATDWGFECLTIADACQASRPEFHLPQLRITQFGNGLFGTVASAEALLTALETTGENNECR